MEYHEPLVSAETVFENLGHEKWVVFDCRHQLTDPEWGPQEYQKAHIPGAFHAHVDRDLSADPKDGLQGRHPMPDPDTFVTFLQDHGVDKDSQVVCYDDFGGAWAGRMWWLLRHYGHRHVAVLDGGLNRWKDLDLKLSDKQEKAKKGDFEGEPGHMPTVDALRIEAEIGQEIGAYQIVDARAPERYSGEMEPIDPVAGHIPGAINAPFTNNLESDMRFLSPDELRANYERLLGVQEVGRVATYCGSGVTAAHNVLAMEVAGLGTAALYPGSWSEWCQEDQERPIKTGPKP